MKHRPAQLPSTGPPQPQLRNTVDACPKWSRYPVSGAPGQPGFTALRGPAAGRVQARRPARLRTAVPMLLVAGWGCSVREKPKSCFRGSKRFTTFPNCSLALCYFQSPKGRCTACRDATKSAALESPTVLQPNGIRVCPRSPGQGLFPSPPNSSGSLPISMERTCGGTR